MAQQKGAALQDPFLNILRKERIPVSIYLIYKHAISTIVPSRAVRIPYDTPGYSNEDDIDQDNIGQN